MKTIIYSLKKWNKLWLLFLLLFLLTCQEEDYLNQTSPPAKEKNSYTLNRVAKNKLPETVQQNIASIFKSNNNSFQAKPTGGKPIDTYRISPVLDIVLSGRFGKNYSLDLDYTKTVVLTNETTNSKTYSIPININSDANNFAFGSYVITPSTTKNKEDFTGSIHIFIPEPKWFSKNVKNLEMNTFTGIQISENFPVDKQLISNNVLTNYYIAGNVTTKEKYKLQYNPDMFFADGGTTTLVKEAIMDTDTGRDPCEDDDVPCKKERVIMLDEIIIVAKRRSTGASNSFGFSNKLALELGLPRRISIPPIYSTNNTLNGGFGVTPIGGGGAPVTPISLPSLGVTLNPLSLNFATPVLKLMGIKNTKVSKVFTQPQKDWLAANPVIAARVAQFLNNANYSFSALSFTTKAINALKGGSGANTTVNWENRIINELTGKALCVYKKLEQLNSTFFSNLINEFFKSSKNAHIKFEVGDIPDDNNFKYKARTYPSYNSAQRFYRVRLKTSFVKNASLIEIALAIIHETIHAELLDRSIQSGLILNIKPNGSYTFQNYGNISTYNNITIFNALTTYYKNLGNGNPQWNHDQFNIFGYRQKLSENLNQIHPWLDDLNNPLINFINSDSVITDLDDFFDYLSWEGLEGTQEYINLNDDSKTKKDYISQYVRSEYNKKCK
ncbi:hypothetical protein [Polaribacter cellanae]|uniref:Uncharacterized protein n=1 Tax=Polaribacter cellanae TaxID=2818493 RepID=A0A975H7W6_9FLAO|nr:hypothetical protein [Polaribacter cellanae]QTE23897.1 hypothetical protein J3359_06400 [Polaribacter cellanae]